MTTTCIYSELDTFSGYIGHDSHHLSTLVNDLKLLCLLYDQVIVNTPAILEHPLTLPAFEILLPFVKSGVLWTSTGNSRETPFAFIENRIEKTYGYKKNRKTEDKIGRTLERWNVITPDKWKLFRSIDSQVNNATLDIIKKIKNIVVSNKEIKYKYQILDLVEDMRINNVFNREYLLANMDNFKGKLSIETVRNISILIQLSYIKQGTNKSTKDSNNITKNIVLFPSTFFKSINSTKELEGYLPVDIYTIYTITSRFKYFGYTLKSLLNLPTYELFLLSQSDHWIALRRILLSNKWDEQIASEMLSLHIKGNKISKSLGIIYKQIKPSEIIFSSDWQLISKSFSGNLGSSENKKANYIFNINTRKITLDKDKFITFTKNQNVLISSLILAGNSGVHIDQIIKLEIERENISKTNRKWIINYSKIKNILESSRLNRLYVVKNRINYKLECLQLKIITNNGYWILEKPTHKSVSIHRSIFEVESSSHNFKKIEDINLTPQNKKLFLLLNECSPYFVNSEQISISLFKNKKNIQRKISDSIYKLQKKLNGSSYRIEKDYAGGYALIDSSS